MPDPPAIADLRRRAEPLLDRARRSGEPLSVLVADVDGFRALNGARGSDLGDAVLERLDVALRGLAPAPCVVGRTGADEWAAVLPDLDLVAAADLGAALLDAVERAEGPPGSAFTVSVGVVPYRRGAGVERLLADAGTGVDRARACGGARVSEGGLVDLVDPASEVRTAIAEALVSALAERDAYTGAHSRAVVTSARDVARVLGLDDAETERVAIAAALHDIGKVAIPDALLHKPGLLEPDERAVLQSVPLVGERILRAIPGLGDVARIVRHVHERHDGSGRPEGLSGDAIPIGSRIILACDTYHAMTAGGSYRARLSHSDAVRELVAGAGTQFDPKVTEALIGDLYHRRLVGQAA